MNRLSALFMAALEAEKVRLAKLTEKELLIELIWEVRYMNDQLESINEGINYEKRN